MALNDLIFLAGHPEQVSVVSKALVEVFRAENKAVIRVIVHGCRTHEVPMQRPIF